MVTGRSSSAGRKFGCDENLPHGDDAADRGLRPVDCATKCLGIWSRAQDLATRRRQDEILRTAEHVVQVLRARTLRTDAGDENRTVDPGEVRAGAADGAAHHDADVTEFGPGASLARPAGPGVACG